MTWPISNARQKRAGRPLLRACSYMPCNRTFTPKRRSQKFCHRRCSIKASIKRLRANDRESFLVGLDQVTAVFHRIDSRRNTFIQRFSRPDISDLHDRVSRGLTIYALTREELYREPITHYDRTTTIYVSNTCPGCILCETSGADLPNVRSSFP